MMNFLGRYSNGWGHLIVTIAALAFCLILLLTSDDVSIKSLVIGVVMTLIGYWFGGKAVKQRKQEKDDSDS